MSGTARGCRRVSEPGAYGQSGSVDHRKTDDRKRNQPWVRTGFCWLAGEE